MKGKNDNSVACHEVESSGDDMEISSGSEKGVETGIGGDWVIVWPF